MWGKFGPWSLVLIRILEVLFRCSDAYITRKGPCIASRLGVCIFEGSTI